MTDVGDWCHKAQLRNAIENSAVVGLVQIMQTRRQTQQGVTWIEGWRDLKLKASKTFKNKKVRLEINIDTREDIKTIVEGKR